MYHNKNILTLKHISIVIRKIVLRVPIFVAGVQKRLVTLRLDDPSISLFGHPNEALYRDGKPCGWLTSGGFSHTLGCPIALGYHKNLQRNSTFFINLKKYFLQDETKLI